MAETYKALSELSVEQLKARYDNHAASTQVALTFYREEIARREADVLNKAMLAFTRQVRDMTFIIFGMTAVMLVLAGVSVYLAWPK
ncbi:hypothetical protein ACXHMN_18725 [Rhizobium sp. LEGMi12c]